MKRSEEDSSSREGDVADYVFAFDALLMNGEDLPSSGPGDMKSLTCTTAMGIILGGSMLMLMSVVNTKEIFES